MDTLWLPRQRLDYGWLMVYRYLFPTVLPTSAAQAREAAMREEYTAAICVDPGAQAAASAEAATAGLDWCAEALAARQSISAGI